MFQLCSNKKFNYGAYQEYYLIPKEVVRINMFKIPNGITFEEAAQLEPFYCAVFGAALSNIEFGDTVAILGAGAQGLYFLKLAKLVGASRVIMMDYFTYRLDYVKKLGVDEVVNNRSEDGNERLRELTDVRGAEVVIVAAGAPTAWEDAVKMAARGDLVNKYAGCTPGSTLTIPTERIHYDMVKIIGTYHTTPECVHRAWHLIKTRAVDLRPIVTHRMPLDAIQKAFELLATSKEAIKIAILP